MSHPTYFLQGALVADYAGGDGYGYRCVDVTLAGGVIAALRPAGEAPPPQGAELVDCKDKLLLPGSVNAHAHTSEHWARGLIKPLPLELWIHALVRHEPRGVEGGKLLGFEDAFVECPSALVGLSALHAGLETVLGGATGIMDHLWVRNIDDVAAAVAAYRSLGLRVWLAIMLSDTAEDNYANYTACAPNAAERNAKAGGCSCGGMGPGGAFRLKPSGYDPVKTAACAALWEEAVRLFHRPEDGINIAIGPTTCYSASRELIVKGVELRKKYGLCGHTHLLETQSQALQSRQYFGKGGAVGMLRDTGFLSLPGTSLAHSVWLDDAEIAMVADAGASIVHNPASNLRLGSGVAPLRAYRAAGVNVALGADGACSSDGQDMTEVMKLTCLVHTLSTPEYRDWFEPRDALRMATEGGYAAVNLKGKGGVIAEGALADVTLWDLTALSLLPRADPIGTLVLGRPSAGCGGSALHSVWVNGRRLMGAGEALTCDVAKLRADLAAVYPMLRSPAATDPRCHPYTAAAEVEWRAAAGLDGTTRDAKSNPENDFLTTGYPTERTLDDRTCLP